MRYSSGSIVTKVRPTESDHSSPRSKEGRTFVFNDALNIFHLRFYGVGHKVKDYSDNRRVIYSDESRLMRCSGQMDVSENTGFIMIVKRPIVFWNIFVLVVVLSWYGKNSPMWPYCLGES